MGKEVNLDTGLHGRPFNTPIETGLRALYLLRASAPTKIDLQRLIYYDYLLVHSSDPEGPPSIHPAFPHRSGELLVRRQLLSLGLDLMFSKELLVKNFDSSGVLYSASELTDPFLAHLGSPYAQRLRQLAHWVNEAFRDYSDSDLSKYMNRQLGRWGAEFNRESVLRRVAP